MHNSPHSSPQRVENSPHSRPQNSIFFLMNIFIPCVSSLLFFTQHGPIKNTCFIALNVNEESGITLYVCCSTDVKGDDCNCPMNMDEWMKDVQCPASFDQIYQDLAPHPTIPLKGMRKKMLNKFERRSWCHYVVKNNKVRNSVYYMVYMNYVCVAIAITRRLCLLHGPNQLNYSFAGFHLYLAKSHNRGIAISTSFPLPVNLNF